MTDTTDERDSYLNCNINNVQCSESENCSNFAYYNIVEDILGNSIEEDWPGIGVPPAIYPSTTLNDDIVEPAEVDVSKLNENSSWTVMMVKAKDMPKTRKTLVDSGCNRSIFTNRELFTEYREARIPIKTAGDIIYAVGVGTVGKLQNCLHVPTMNINLISVMQAVEDIEHLAITFEAGTCTIHHKLLYFDDLIIPTIDRLIEVNDFRWMGLDLQIDSAMSAQSVTQCYLSKIEYFQGLALQGLDEQCQILHHYQEDEWLQESKFEELSASYLAKADALELLHVQLGHLPYSRIEKMISKGIIRGFELNKHLMKQLIKAKCGVCIRSKATDASHKGQLPLPEKPWVEFATDLSAKFDQASLYGNFYQMVLIDMKSKYVWDYYTETKGQVFDRIQEWLEKEIGLLRGRDHSNYEITLFSDQGEAHSIRVEELCHKYGVVKKSTGGYTPEHNAFAERWYRTNAEMSTCQMLQFDLPEAYWEDSRRMATFIYNRIPPMH